MSGIVGIVHLDGAPVDRERIEQLTTLLGRSGPDARGSWVKGSVAFGHALLDIDGESGDVKQPFTLDGSVWIVADARIDSREALIAKLAARGEATDRGAADVELVLRAYRAWGENCVEHLLGDFTFALWDEREQRLFCARDQLGVKPFFYAQFGAMVVFSSALDCLRAHPAVSNALNDEAIADFLLFDINQNSETTTFADIQRLPPAHCICWRRDGSTRTRYWTLPIDEPLFLARPEEYTERYREIVQTAISDRLRGNAVSVFMSGGLDSSSLAAISSRLLEQRGATGGVRAFTTILDGFDGDERRYAGLVAEHLRIPISVCDMSETLIDPNWEQAAVRTTEPVSDPTRLASGLVQLNAAASHARLGFYGEGPDDVFKYEWRAYLTYLASTRQIRRLLGDVAGHVILHRRIPLLPSVPRMLQARRRSSYWREPFPSWIEPSFEARLQLRARWEDKRRTSSEVLRHPIRPLSYAAFSSPLWEGLFRGFDAQQTGAAFEVTHPFLDIRVLRFSLSVPAMPWCRRKLIVRRAMRGLLPDPILSRDKSALSSDPTWEGARRFGLAPLRPAPELAAYVDLRRVPVEAGDDMVAFRTDMRPRGLNYWLRTSRPEGVPYS